MSCTKLTPAGHETATQMGGNKRKPKKSKTNFQADQLRLPIQTSLRYLCTECWLTTSFRSSSMSTSKNST